MSKKSTTSADKYGIMKPREWMMLEKGDLMVRMVETDIYIGVDLDVNGKFIFKMMEEYGKYILKESNNKNV